MSSFSFNEMAIKESESSFQKLQIVPEQNRRVTAISKVISDYTGLSLLATKGFFWKAFKEWQIENKKPATYILEAPPDKQKELVKEIFSKITRYLERILKDPNDKARLERAMNQAYEYYLKHFYSSS